MRCTFFIIMQKRAVLFIVMIGLSFFTSCTLDESDAVYSKDRSATTTGNNGANEEDDCKGNCEESDING
ncbi:hypothetical protein [Spongiimicrobium salis]|uniref:hypothetical protein n=1 Tax=Spongiimicrobium salis TaxID=1667022 RepID=UPI00374DACB7